jgi:hypothetical protein
MPYFKALHRHSPGGMAENRSSGRDSNRVHPKAYLSTIYLDKKTTKKKEKINMGYVCHEVPHKSRY